MLKTCLDSYRTNKSIKRKDVGDEESEETRESYLDIGSDLVLKGNIMNY